MFIGSTFLAGAFMIGAIGDLGDHYYNKAPVRNHHLHETFISQAHCHPVQINPPRNDFSPAKEASRYLAGLYLFVGTITSGFALRKKAIADNSEQQLSLNFD
ncbi:MAG TPA: hypothetical protein DEA55_07775 [Rhodospirillaceae bacterium]|nr:hypothetical protein [Rhodospirillaceae bacterium]